MNTKIAQEYLNSYIEKITPIFRDFSQNRIKQANELHATLTPLVTYYFQLAEKGKKIRGALTNLGYELCGGGNIKAILKASLAPELFHAGALVQDDLMDNSPTRRGIESYHRKVESISPVCVADMKHYALSQTMLAGDLGYFYAFEALYESGFSSGSLQSAAQLFSKYITRVALGQMLDAANVIGGKYDYDSVMTVMRYKTAEYTGIMPLYMGAVLAGEQNSSRINAIQNFGLSLGWAFQIQDDLLGAFGDESHTGKSSSTDIEENKNTLLVIESLRHATSMQRERLKQLLCKSNKTLSDINEVREIFIDSGAKRSLEKLVQKYTEQAIQAAFLMTSDKHYQNILINLLEYLSTRAK